MEIRIKTAEEFQAAHVTIEIKAADQAEAGTVVERLYTDDEVANLQSSEAALVAGPLQVRINDLEDRLVKSRIRVNELERQVKGYDTDRHTERDRADRVTQEHSACAGKLESREKDANTFQRHRDQLEIKVAELEAERERSADNHNTLANRVTELEADLARVRDDRQMVLTQRDKALTRVGELDGELRRTKARLMEGHACTDACSKDKHVAFVGRKALTEAEHKVSELTLRIDKARAILSNPEVTRVCEMTSARGISFLSREIGKAIDALA
jgi:chromosome segregation ATPase